MIVYGCSLIRHYAACASNDTFPIRQEYTDFLHQRRGRAEGSKNQRFEIYAPRALPLMGIKNLLCTYTMGKVDFFVCEKRRMRQMKCHRKFPFILLFFIELTLI